MKGVSAAIAALWLAGCVAYHAKPIDQARTDAAFRARSLADPGLLRYVQAHGLGLPATRPAAQPPAAPAAWDLNSLTLAAFYYHADLAVVRDQATEARAAVRTAGALPNPTVGIAPGYETDPPFPFIFDLTLDWPIETAGKRGDRIAQARASAEAARWQVAQVAWQVASRVRAALLDYLMARRSAAAAREQAQARRQVLDLLQQRFAAGALARPDLDRARLDLNSAELATQVAAGQAAQTRAALAVAVGVPVEAVEAVRFAWPKLDHPPAENELPPAAVQRTALLGRADLRKSLAEYAAADAALRLEIARQYPDLHISPGYSYDEGVHKYTLGASLTLPILNQNQGPIAEAEARRGAAGAAFLALQADVIGQSQQASARYRAALAELVEANRIFALSEQHQRNVQQALAVGQQDRLALADAQVETTAARSAQLDAVHQAQAALGAVEDAMQRPLGRPRAALPPLPIEQHGGKE